MTSVHSTIQRISAVIAIFNNILLIYLIKFKSHSRVGKYKYLMIYISVFELLYAFLDLFGVPKFFTKDSLFIVAIYSEQSLAPPIFSKIFVHAFCVFFGISMAIFAIHFIYRYMVVSENVIVKKYDYQVVIGLLVIPVLIGIFWESLCIFLVAPFEQGDRFLTEYHLNKIGVNLSDVRYSGVYFWPIGNDGEHHIHWKSSIGIFIMTFTICLSVCIILYFGYKCYYETCKLIQNASQSQSFNKLQSQLFYTLVLQTIIPLVLMHLPAAIGFSAAFFNISVELLGDICSFTIYLYPTFDPLPNFFIIKNYREAILDAFRCFKVKVLKMTNNKVQAETVVATEVPSTPEN